MSRFKWTNPSVKALAGTEDPFSVIRSKAHACLLSAVESGLAGPPFDPIELARTLGIATIPRADVRDARLVVESGNSRIEFDPNQPRERVRFSIAHEIGHTLFPDYADLPRNRSWESRGAGDEWQLEVLCNAAAAELLMPVEVFEHLAGTELDLNQLIAAHRHFGVSMEALLIRAVELADTGAAAFVAGRRGTTYQLDYVRTGHAWDVLLEPGFKIPSGSCIGQCKAVGYTSTAVERWFEGGPELRVECIGLSPYPGQRVPRVAGLVSLAATTPRISGLRLVAGDALSMHASTEAPRALVQIVNDKARHWGGGFSRAVAQAWPQAERDYVANTADPTSLELGSVHATQVDDDFWVVSLVAQHGYGPSKRPRIRYEALDRALAKLRDLAELHGWQLHMPRIGTGASGANWSVVRQLLESRLVSRGIDVVVYAPAGSTDRQLVALQSGFELV